MMGNVANVTLKEDLCVEITKEQVQDFKEKVHVVDQTMSGFAKSLDSLKASCELLLRETDKQATVSQEETSYQNNTTREAELAVQILKTIHESLSDQKISAFESLIKLLHFIDETGSRYTGISDNKALGLSLEEYIKTAHVETIQLPYHETRIEDLRKELTMQIDLNKISDEENRILNERLNSFQDEKDQLKGRLKNKDDEIRRLTDEIESLKRETKHSEDGYEYISSADTRNVHGKYHAMIESGETNLTFVSTHLQDVSDAFQSKGTAHQFEDETKTQDNTVSDLRHKIQTLQTQLNYLYRKTCLHVQILNKGTSKKSVVDVIEKLKLKINTPTCELYIIKRKEAAEVDKELPLLVFSNTKLGPSNAAKDALNGLETKKTTALLLVHRDVSESSIRSSAATILALKYKSLGGIVDILHELPKGIVQGQLNSRGFDELSEFIKGCGVVKSRVETFQIEKKHHQSQ